MTDKEKEYDVLSLIQSLAILLTAISVFDLGYAGFVDRGIWFNYVLFDAEDPSFLKKSAFWDAFQFWGYCFFIVAVCQILKSLPDGFTLRPHQLKFGKASLSLFFGAPVISLIIASRDYDFQTNALSSLVDYGWIPTVIMSWGVMSAMICAWIYFYYFDIRQISDRIAITLFMSSAAMFFLTALTLPRDQPFSHTFFGNFSWYLAILGSLFYSIPRRHEDIYPVGHAIFTALYVLFAVSADELGIDLFLWLSQMVAGFLIGMWFYTFEDRKSKRRKELSD